MGSTRSTPLPSLLIFFATRAVWGIGDLLIHFHFFKSTFSLRNSTLDTITLTKDSIFHDNVMYNYSQSQPPPPPHTKIAQGHESDFEGLGELPLYVLLPDQ